MNDVKKILKQDYKRIFNKKISLIRKIKLIYTSDLSYMRWKYIKYMRLCDNLNYNENFINKFRKLYYQRKKNKIGMLLGYEITSTNIGAGICLYHNGPIVINGKSIIGENCSLHGDNCIGNDGKSDSCPVIGKNVDIGVGAKIVGNVKIANNVVIGAGGIVVTDILKENCVVVGVPGKIVERKYK